MVDLRGALGAALITAAAILLHGWMTSSTYTLSASGGDGSTSWRINTRTGQVSVCGTMLHGHALSQASLEDFFKMKGQLEGAGFPKKEVDEWAAKNGVKASDDKDFKAFSIPRCSEWSSP